MTTTLARCLALFLAALLLAAPLPARSDAARFERGLLWRIERPGIAPSYLFGTLHADDDRILAIPPAARRAFTRASGFALEMVNDEPAIRRYRAAMVTRQPQLAATLGAEDFARVAERLGERGVPVEARARFKPWAALLVLLQPPGPSGIILDHLLLQDAEKLGKTITALETIDEQIAVFDGMAEATQIALLRHVLGRQDAIPEAVRALIAAYLAGDLAAMWQADRAAMGDAPGLAAHNGIFLDRLLYERNRRFAERLTPLLRRGGVFAAFGALHLYGDRGVPALLRAQGWRVTAVR